MVATTGFKGALETNDSQISYGIETAWGTAPAVQFQAIRYTSTTLAGARTTQRPNEITGTREAAQSVTTQVTAGGTINFALSETTFEDLAMANVLQAEWQAAQVINGVSGDITITNSSGVTTLSSTTSGKFSNISAKQWIRLFGFTNTANNYYWFVESKADNQNLTLIGGNTAVTETPTGSTAHVRSSTIKNGKVCRTFFVEMALDTDKIMQYPGSYGARMTLSGATGAFTTGTVDLVAQKEQKVSSTSSSGAILAAPTGRVIDPIGGFIGCFFNGAPLGTIVQSFGITLENTGASSEFAMGSASAGGILTGTFTASGTLRTYFKDFTLYQNSLDETSGELAIIVQDSTGAGYAFTYLDAKLNGRIGIGGPGQAVTADYTIEAGPTANGTFVIDRLPAS